MLSLEQANKILLTAIESEDLGRIAEALQARSAAIAGTPVASATDIEAGERALRALRTLQQRWALESARLGQVSTAFVAKDRIRGARIDCRA